MINIQAEKPDEAGPVTHSVEMRATHALYVVIDASGNEVKYCASCCQGTGWCEVFVEAGGQFLIDDDELVRCWIKRPGPLVVTPMDEPEQE
jgi:hypothetical protein